ncbi:HK97-gp10 family putative phage morphogenesis protein [Clostridium haemolyticum]|uniref:HK97-gp10 family putative phage morphogenesis protein n=1 Tax=Clostridium haemolyticum TaxID=84025 RepID=UPI00177C3EE2
MILHMRLLYDDYKPDERAKLEDKKNTLDKAGNLVKRSMEIKAPKFKENKRHMADDNINVSDIKNEDGVDFVKIGLNKGDNSEFFYSKFSEWGTSKQPAQHWAENRKSYKCKA